MKILYYFPERKSFMYKWQRIHIFDELKNNGHSICVFNPLNFNSFNEANDRLIRYIKENKASIDLFMSCANSEMLFQDTISKIKEESIPTLLICFDNLHAPFQHKKIAPSFDLVWLTSKETAYMFKKWGGNIIFLPYAANSNAFRPNFEDEIYGVGFVGTPYGTRINKINALLKAQIRCHIYSNSVNGEDNSASNTDMLKLLKSFYQLSKFKIGHKVILGALRKKLFNMSPQKLIDNNCLSLHSSVDFARMNTLYSNFSLSLGITELRNTYLLKNPVHKLHLRTFEIPMCGGLQLSPYLDELSEYFEEGREIILYKSEEEFLSKAKFYLRKDNKKLRKNMKLNAYKRAKNEHTWMNRFSKIFNRLSLK